LVKIEQEAQLLLS